MMVLPVRIKHALNVSVQRPHDADARKLVGPPDVATRINASIAACSLRGLVLGLRKFGDVLAGILERDKLAATRQRYWLFEPSFPEGKRWKYSAASRRAAVRSLVYFSRM
jgi:hypothetical protein